MSTPTLDRPVGGRHAERTGRAIGAGAFSPGQLWRSLPDALRKLDPRIQARNPVMFVVWVGSVLVTGLAVITPSVFSWLIAVWLWATVLFANLAEAVAEGRGKAQADSLRRTRTDTVARRLREDGREERVPGTVLRVGDRVVVEAGEVIPGDGDIIEGIASVDESAITGESAPVIRESGGDRSSVTGGTTVLSDRIVVQITAAPGETFVDRMIALVEGAQRQKTPNEIALTILLAALTIIFLLAVVALQPMAGYSGEEQSLVVLTALLVCLIPTTIGALLSAIGIAGMDRLVQRNVLATSGRAVEAAGDVDTLLLDKTGTITFGNRRATALHPAPRVQLPELAAAARLSSLADQTPEGRSIVDLCAAEHGLPVEATQDEAAAAFVPFTAQTRMSGLDLVRWPRTSAGSSRDQAAPPPCEASTWKPLFPPTTLVATALAGREIRKGAASAVAAWLGDTGLPPDVTAVVDRVSTNGGTPLVVAEREPGIARVLGVVELSDVVKPGMAQRFAEMRAMGIRTVMVTGDNPLTARAIAAQAGVDDFLAEATPEDKIALIRREQEGGRLVAMTGDGTNDAPALAQADVGVTMNTGTAAAKEAGNMVDLDSDPTKLIDVVEIGKQLLITRGALTTFSVANDVAKYFAIVPAMFAVVYPQLAALNVMRLATPQSAILSAVIFNALVIVALIPLALRGVRYRPTSAAHLLRRNLLIYGLGGVVVPFLGIFLIDLVVRFLPGNLVMVNLFLRQSGAALRMLLLATLMLGLVYPLAVWGVARLPGLHGPAEGSVLTAPNGTASGSSLIGIDPVPANPAADPYFHSRPSASATDVLGPGDPSTSGGSNLGGFSAKLLDQVQQRRAAVAAREGVAPAAVPADAVTASGSGLDPHISPAYADLQVARVARVTGLPETEVRTLVARATEGRVLGFLGEPTVNVTALNLAVAAARS